MMLEFITLVFWGLLHVDEILCILIFCYELLWKLIYACFGKM